MPFLYFTIFLCLGILSAAYFNIPLVYLFSLAILFILSALFSLNRKIISHISIYLAIFFLGFISYQISDTLPDGHISRLTPQDGEEVVVKGIIVDYPVVSTTFYRTERTSFILRVESFASGNGWLSAEGLAKVNLYGDPLDERPAFGDEVALKGAISKPKSFRNPGLFDYARYLKFKDIYSVLTVKDSFSAKILRRHAAGRFNPPSKEFPPVRVGMYSEGNFSFGGFSLHRSGKRDSTGVRAWSFKNSAYAARRVICDAIDRFFDIRLPDNGFLKAILVGDRSNLKESIEEDFIKTGTVHILSVSGTHVGLIACIFFFIFGVLGAPRKLNTALTAFLLVFYSFVVGLNPPIVRSTIMFIVFAAGYIINREGDILNTLSLAAFLILLPQPKALFDPGFQLSFSSIGGIIILSPGIEGLFRPAGAGKRSALSRMKLYARKAVSISLAAWLGVAPIVSFYFNIVSPAAVIANFVVVPAVFLVMILSSAFLPLSIAAGCFSVLNVPGAITAALTELSGWLAWAIRTSDRILFTVNHRLAELPFSFFRVPPPSFGFFIIYYLALAVLIFPGMRGAFLAAIRRRYAYLALLLFLNIILWQSVFCHTRAGDLRVTFLDVGRGDAALVEFPEGNTILIDGGSGGSEEKLDMGKIIVAPYLWKRGITRLDAVVVTHFHEDHLGGLLYILDNFGVGCAIDNGAETTPQNVLYDRYKKIIKKRRIRRIVVGRGDEIKGISGAKLLFLNPDKTGKLQDSNENSLAVKLVYAGSSVLFAGDIGDNAISRLNLYKEMLRADILKFPHHGGVFKNTEELKKFLYNVSPQISVVSGRRAKSPNDSSKNISSLLDSLRVINYDISDDGAIIVTRTGKDFKIKTP